MTTNQNDIVTEFSIDTLLSSEVNYIIPVYQRNYAWDIKEIHQLIDDVYSSSNKNYYIGTLVVAQDKSNPSHFEVIDGQQRLTTLFLLAAYLGIEIKSKLTFESREKSNKTLEAIFSKNDVKTLNHESYSQEIIHGFKVIEEKIKKEWKEKFSNYLKGNVILMRVKVPDDTNLNQYFEIMNTRGEQLEKHEIVKAHLLSILDDSNDRHCFNKIWESCENMERYVPMEFSTDKRDEIFSRSCLNVTNFSEFRNLMKEKKKNDADESKSIFDLIKLVSNNKQSPVLDEKQTEEKEDTDNEVPERFSSIINFPNFLLHTLRVMKNSYKGIPLDDKKIIETFKNQINSTEDAKNFIFALLKCKFLFDNYIIKRDFKENVEGKWNLLRWWNNKDGKDVGTFKIEGGEDIRLCIIMILSAFHVSDSSMQRKHWLNAALQYLYDCKKIIAKDYLERLEFIAKRFVFDRILVDKGENYDSIIYPRKEKHQNHEIDYKLPSYGKIKNNFIFNYLDYLLWIKHKDKYKNFRFTSRHSVEHFLPQDTTYSEKASKEEINSFGNLCLINHSDNSSYSNHSPTEKRNRYKTKKAIHSIKQDLMMQKADKWDATAINTHQEEMIDLLKQNRLT